MHNSLQQILKNPEIEFQKIKGIKKRQEFLKLEIIIREEKEIIDLHYMGM